MKFNNERCDGAEMNYNQACQNYDMGGMAASFNGAYMGAGVCPCPQEMMGETLPGVVCPPVYECPRETVVNRYICHEVPHIMPCNTRIVNHHIYRHTYTPQYSCCEENEVQNVYERRCC